jgi:predicted ATPase
MFPPPRSTQYSRGGDGGGITRGMAVTDATGLLERERELAALAADLAAVRSETGRLLLVEGPAGIGKTELLAVARSLAEESGMVVARARGSELETGFGFGVVRQLFEPLLRACPQNERHELLRGAAGLASEVLGTGGVGSTSGEVRWPDVLHGLYWLTLNLAERAPLLVLIDDAHWADRSSLRFLTYLAGRLDGAGVLVVAATRPAEARAADDTLGSVEREPATTVIGLRPLSLDAAAELLAREYHAEVAPEFAQAAWEATGGNPF